MKTMFLLLILSISPSIIFGQNYVKEWQSPNGSGPWFPGLFFRSPNHVDMDGDGTTDIIVKTYADSTILVYHPINHNLIWTYQLPSDATLPIGFGNITDEQTNELVLNQLFPNTGTGEIAIVNTTTNASTIIATGSYHYSCMIYDIDGDGKDEVLVEVVDAFSYHLEIWGDGTQTAIKEKNVQVDRFKLQQNYPNPFNPTTTIEYSVQKAGKVQIRIYNTLGQLVRNLVNESKTIGEYSVTWDGKNDNGKKVSSGTYFYQLQVDDFISTKKMLVVK